MSLGSYVDEWDGKRRHIIATTVHTYDISFSLSEDGNPLVWQNITRERAARILGAVRTCGDTIHSLVVTHFADLDYLHVILCKDCKSRPVEWEWDCDGKHPLVFCHEVQCFNGQIENEG